MDSKILRYILLLSVMMFVSCSKYEFHGYPSASYFAVVNESSHDIRIFWFVGKPNTSEGFLNTIPYLPDETKLSPRESETYEYHYNYFNEDGLQPPMMMFKGQAFIVYDNEIVYRARYGKEGDYHNLLDNSTYEAEHIKNKKKHHSWKYSYTFTDADYDYAVANQEKIK